MSYFGGSSLAGLLAALLTSLLSFFGVPTTATIPASENGSASATSTAGITVSANATQVTQANATLLVGDWVAQDVASEAILEFEIDQQGADPQGGWLATRYSPDCNAGGGTSRINEQNRLEFGEYARTERACSAAQRQASQWLDPVVLGKPEMYFDARDEVLYLVTEERTVAFDKVYWDGHLDGSTVSAL